MNRIKCSSVTDTLITAMEKADEMDGVLVLYFAKEGGKGSYFCDEGTRAHDLLWLIEQFKAYLLGLVHRPDNIDEEGGEP